MNNEPIFSVLTGKAQSCDSNGNCYYCVALFQAPRIFGTFTVTGAGSVTFTDPNDANNPYNGTFDINGTYTYNNGFWSKDNGRLVIEPYDLDAGSVSITFDVCSSEGPYTPCLAENVGGDYNKANNCRDYLWSASGYTDIQNNCSSYVIGNFSTNSGYYCAPNGIVVTGSAPTVTWNPDNTNRTICNNAGGVYAGVYHSYYPGDGYYYSPTSTVEECLIYTLVPDAAGAGSGGECATPSSPGGTYTFVSKNSFAGDNTNYSIGGVGTCCSGDCVTPFTDCTTNGVTGDWGFCQ